MFKCLGRRESVIVIRQDDFLRVLACEGGCRDEEEGLPCIQVNREVASGHFHFLKCCCDFPHHFPACLNIFFVALSTDFPACR